MTPRNVLEFQGETGLLLRGDSNIGIPFLTKQRNRHSCQVEEGKTGLFLSCGVKLGVPFTWGRVSLGPSSVASRVSSTLSRFKRERGVSVQTLLWKRASSHVEGRILWFFSSCGGKLGIPLEL